MLSETLDKAIEIREIAKQLTQRVQEIQEALAHLKDYTLIRKTYKILKTHSEHDLYIYHNETFTSFDYIKYKNWLSGLQIELKNREIRKLEEEKQFYQEALSDLQIMLDAL